MVNLHPSISRRLNAEDLPTLPTITYFVRALSLSLSFLVPVVACVAGAWKGWARRWAQEKRPREKETPPRVRMLSR